MASSSSSGGGWVVVVFGIFLFALSFGWLAIPSKTDVGGMDVASLSFANGILVGWADDIAANLFSETEAEAARALAAYRQTILIGEQHFPGTTIVFTVIGTFLSVGGVIAVALARSADAIGQAFMLGFGAEVAEGVAFSIGYTVTTGKNGVSIEEVGATIVVATIMGVVAMGVWSKYKKSKSQ